MYYGKNLREIIEESSQEQVPSYVNEEGTKDNVYSFRRYQVVGSPGDRPVHKWGSAVRYGYSPLTKYLITILRDLCVPQANDS